MKTILFCGGGSAGHVIPNVALIEELKKDFTTVYAGTGAIEESICNENSIKFYKFEAVKFVRGKILCNLSIPFKLLKSIRQAKKILNVTKPDLVFCKGGYVSIPVAIAASKKKIRVMTHESDLSAGLANRLIAHKCVKVLTSFPSTAEKFENGVFTGSPMRKSIFDCDKSALNKMNLPNRKTILVFGGGSGSTVINKNVRAIALEICKKYNMIHICGKNNVVETNIQGYKQIEFTNDIGSIYACADAAVARCGSNSAHELIALKIPTLFIPLGNSSSRGDQIKNAEYFKSLGLCHVLKETELSPATLKREIDLLFSDNKIKTALDNSNIECGNDRIIRQIKSVLR